MNMRTPTRWRIIRSINSALGIRHYSYLYVGRARYVRKPLGYVLTDVAPLPAADERPLADIPKRLPAKWWTVA